MKYVEQFVKVFIFFVSTVFILIITVPFLGNCSGWNESSMAGKCELAFLEPVYNISNNFGILLAFTGFIWIPVLILLKSFIKKALNLKKRARHILKKIFEMVSNFNLCYNFSIS